MKLLSLLKELDEQVLPRLIAGEGCLLPTEDRIVTDDDWQEAYLYHNHSHNYFEWFWMLSGCGYMKIGGRVYQMRPGDCCFLPPRTQHADVFNAQTKAYQSLWFGCHSDQVNVVLFSYKPVGRWSTKSYRYLLATPELPGLLMNLQHEIEQPRSYGTAVQRGLLLQLVGLLARMLSTHSPSTDSPPCSHVSRRALLYLEQHYAENVTLQDVARAVFLSPNYLAFVFKRETKQTVITALTDIRMRHAKRLLLENRLSLREVSQAVGYEHPSHFSRIFRRETGIPPGHYGK